MKWNGHSPLTLKEFISYLLNDAPVLPNIHAIWQFEGAYMSGNTLQWGDFPMEQTLSKWAESFADWQRAAKGYK